jgi:hypothetical protein
MGQYTENELAKDLENQDYKFGFVTDVETETIPVGLNEDIIRLISTKKEVIDNIKRLQTHPSITIWAGNNENEQDLPQSQSLISAYSDLYFKTILANISTIDTTRPMTGSSPSNGNETAAAPFCYNHQSEFYGDMHS